jgi:kinesin family member 5
MEGDITNEDGKGIIPRAVESLFQGVTEADENIEFTFKVSYVEIYLEKIRDLLDEHRTKTNLTIREDKLKGVYIAGVTEEYVTSVEELLQVMHLGALNRPTAARRIKSITFCLYNYCYTNGCSNQSNEIW